MEGTKIRVESRITKESLEALQKGVIKTFIETELRGILWRFVEAKINTECPHCGALYNELSDYDLDEFIEQVKEKGELCKQ